MISGRNMTALEPTAVLQVQIGRGVATRSVSVPAPPDLDMTWTIPGGDDTCTFTLPAAGGGRAAARPDALTQGMPVRVVDRRTGEILWAGRVVDPGMRRSGADQGFRVNAVGSRQDLDRNITIKSYIDRDVGDSFKEGGFYRQGSVNVGDGSGFSYNANDVLQMIPTGNLEFSLPQGSVLANNSVEAASYLKAYGAVLGLPAEAPDLYYITWTMAASIAANINYEVLVGTRSAGNILLYTIGWSTAQASNAGKEGVGAWAGITDAYYYTLRWNRGLNGAATQAADQWMKVANLITVNKRYDRYGVQWTATVNTDLTTLYPYQVVEDMLGTMLAGKFTAGDITRSATGIIDQASWYKGISGKDLLDYVAGYDTDSFWAVWAPATPDGLPRLDWKKWGTTPRYVLDQDSDYELAGGADLWANSALVVWQRGNGVPQATRASVDVPAITRAYGAGFRSIVLDLTDRGVMDGPSARAIGVQELAQVTVDRNSGQVTVRGPVMDDRQGRLVQPWEIRPGSPLQLTAAPQRHTAGGPLAYDGETTFRLTSVRYSASNNTADLSLDGGQRRLFKAGKQAPIKIIPLKK